jgi:acyl transferase domain-containing protein
MVRGHIPDATDLVLAVLMKLAGLSIEDVSASKTACFVGAFTREYEGMMARDEENVSTYHATGNGMAMLANRISWFYNLQGPSLTLDTACSSSLTGLHLACQSLRNGESSMAILGGVNLFFNPDAMFPLSAMGFLSPDGQCYAFDHRANGYVRGEGFASVILQPLSGAIRDGRTIRAVVRSTGLNQDGHTPGITLPNGKSQEELIRNTYATAQLDMSLTRYFEAHGTGTPAGDPIEAGAIAAAFETSKRDSNNPLFIGAVKSNIGHLEGTSGLAGLIKTICVLETGLIPPNTAFEKPNPRIPAEAWKIKVREQLTRSLNHSNLTIYASSLRR